MRTPTLRRPNQACAHDHPSTRRAGAAMLESPTGLPARARPRWRSVAATLNHPPRSPRDPDARATCRHKREAKRNKQNKSKEQEQRARAKSKEQEGGRDRLPPPGGTTISIGRADRNRSTNTVRQEPRSKLRRRCRRTPSPRARRAALSAQSTEADRPSKPRERAMGKAARSIAALEALAEARSPYTGFARLPNLVRAPPPGPIWRQRAAIADVRSLVGVSRAAAVRRRPIDPRPPPSSPRRSSTIVSAAGRRALRHSRRAPAGEGVARRSRQTRQLDNRAAAAPTRRRMTRRP
jgi:hypothetical protein